MKLKKALACLVLATTLIGCEGDASEEEISRASEEARFRLVSTTDHGHFITQYTFIDDATDDLIVSFYKATAKSGVCLYSERLKSNEVQE